ncbi:MAG: hypothetical protein R3200_07965 [Xanthomonadales bacterium]|nr:hypothetical protein [Xanthomonadales bacterium]
MSKFGNTPGLAAAGALCVLLFSADAQANGCIIVRPSSALTLDLEDVHTPRQGRFELSMAYRYLYSDRHFRGREEESHRQAEGTDVRNEVHTIDYTLTYRHSDRWSFSAALPYVTANRSSLYEHDRVSRHAMEADGIGDLRLMAYRSLALGESERPRGVTLGFGVKLPTGKDDVTDIAYRPDGPEVRNVDQSIQPGDGGFGFFAEAQAYARVFDDHTFAFFTGSYLVNPRDTNGVSTHRRRETEAVMSVADSYQARAGFSRMLQSVEGLTVDAGLRIEGVPADDLVGDSNGFRRPGYAVYFEPGFNYRKGPHRFNLNVPIAIERNRVKSKADRLTGRHGDAAFADYLVMASYTFGW